MSEYQTQESLGVILGGRLDEVGLLGRTVARSSTGTSLFHEIEKASFQLPGIEEAGIESPGSQGSFEALKATSRVSETAARTPAE